MTSGGLNGLVAEQTSQQLQRSLSVPFSLHYKVEHLALVVDGAPKVHPSSPYIADHLIETPARGGGWPALLQAPGEWGSKLDRPAANDLIADVEPRCAIISSTSRRLRVKRKYNHTAWRITSGGKRWRLNETGRMNLLPHNDVLSRKVETF